MRTFVFSTLLMVTMASLIAGTASMAQAQTIRVAVQDGSSNGTGNDIVTQLNNNPNYNFDATLITDPNDLDTVAKLNDYDVVIVGCSGGGSPNFNWTAQMWSAMRDWVDDGGGIIAVGWFIFYIDTSLPGWADVDYLIPGQTTLNYRWVNGSTMLDFSSNPNHPIVDGINNFAPNSSHIEYNEHALQTNDIRIGTVNGATNSAIIARENIGAGEGRSVYLGPIYMAGTPNYTTTPLRSGDADRLLAQTVDWVAGVSPPDVGSVAPDPVAWGDTLTITGADLDNATVTIGGEAAAITLNTDVEIQATVSAATPINLQTVEVTTSGGNDDTQSVTVTGFPPSITSVSPNPVGWLESLTIDGSYLAHATVTIGGIEANIISNTPDEIVVEVADGTPVGAQNIFVDTPVGTDTASVTVDSVAPQLSMASPDPVEWLQTLTITGSALATAESVTIGGVESTIEEAQADTLLVRVSSATPLDSQPIEVTTAGGTATGLSVTVLGVGPVVTGVAPDPVRVTQTLTITGEALANAESVTIGGVETSIVSNTAIEIRVTVLTATALEADQPVVITTEFGIDDSQTVEVLPAPISTGRGCATTTQASTGTVPWLILLLLLAIAHGRRSRHG